MQNLDKNQPDGQFSVTISGTVDKFLFQSADVGFCIFILTINEKGGSAPPSPSKSVTVKGTLANIQIGEEVQLKGKWIYHNKFGRQFEAKECISKAPTTIVGLKKYLGSGLIKGIGPSYAQKLVNYFGEDVLNIIDKTPERLLEIEGIGEKRLESIVQAWKDQKEIANLMVFLRSKDITLSIAAKIYKAYKHSSLAVLHENPYRLADDIWGIGFKTADDIAKKLGFDFKSPKRIASAIIYIISTISNQGHLYIELENLKEKTADLLEISQDSDKVSLLKQALHTLYNQEKIKVISHRHAQQNEQHFVTLSSYYFSEKNLAQKIKNFISIPSKFNFNINFIYQNLRVPNQNEIYLHEDQQRGILSCLQNKLTIITGGPGTGKTTLIKKLLDILDAERIKYKIAAPTGRAARRIVEGTGRYAETIHRLLEFDFTTMSFTHNESNALDLNFLIIDEASMIDIFLAQAIFKALPLNSHLALIGDTDQLPSVGPGNFLNDLILSVEGANTGSGLEKASCVRLTQIFRQAQDSLIIVNAHRINKGEFPVTYLDTESVYKSSGRAPKKDFIFIKEENSETIIEHLKKILFIEINKRGISLDDTQILTPMNRGPIGTYSLNIALQKLLNPDYTVEQIGHSGVTFKLHDKVMQIRNNYEKRVFNGDIGIIKKIDLHNRKIIVNFDAKSVTYEFDELNELVHAYAISIHKSQGSEYSAVIVPIFMQHYMLLKKKLIYTALTRAKKLCIFIGQTKALAVALNNQKGTRPGESERLTFLKHFLIEKDGVPPHR